MTYYEFIMNHNIYIINYYKIFFIKKKEFMMFPEKCNIASCILQDAGGGPDPLDAGRVTGGPAGAGPAADGPPERIINGRKRAAPTGATDPAARAGPAGRPARRNKQRRRAAA